MTRPRTAAQNRKMWALASELGIDDDLLHEIVEDETGQKHISKLTHAQAEAVIKRLISKLPKDKRKRKRSTPREQTRDFAADNIIHLINQREVALVYAIARNDLGWHDERIEGFVRRQTDRRKRHVESLTREEFVDVVEGLKAIAKREGGQNATDRAT